MRTIIITAAALAAIVPAVASADADERRFTRDGETYVYKHTVRADGATILTGRRLGGSPFRLIVAGTSVSGRANGHSISFSVADAQSASTELAAK